MITITSLRHAKSKNRIEELKKFPARISRGEMVWVDVEDPKESEIKELKERFSLDSYAIEDVMHGNQRPKMEDYKEYLFAVIHIPTLKNRKYETLEVFFFFQKNWIISIHSGSTEVTQAVESRIKTRGLEPLASNPTPDLLFYTYLDFAVDAYYPMLDEAEEQIETLDSKAMTSFKQRSKKFDLMVGAMSTIGGVRKRIRSLRKSLVPTRDMVGMIMRGAVPFIQDSSLRSFRDVYDHSFQLLETIDNYRDRTSDVRELYINLLMASTDNIIKLLTIVATIFLPLALLAGIYGTNFTPGFFEPGSSTPTGFYILIGSMLLIAIALLYSFRRSGWI
ncbi:MAG: magnesium/cobalt transporter CorA [Candidatus Micrarchaeota archaeon]|nr:magnesium/cobalt transporter CorA [Candidatus Micrarchaeota archaeon]MDE1824201.1 magnesium/cobalt transporter CorA [Candidatus Micrarchaeota archaeon]MDE1849672.1 magnesium/cobalt transporter CorA [Candidatus Micrarchaeota archaeon]